jgi:hypothetical protein
MSLLGASSDVRRLAAIDMHALEGRDRRRRIIIVEFVLGAVVGIALGAFLVAQGGSASVILGLYAIGVGANYVPLSAHALSLRDPEVLRAELRGVDLRAELRRYTGWQFLVFVPFLFVWLALSR